MAAPKVLVISHTDQASGAEAVTLSLFRNNPGLRPVLLAPEGDYAEAFRRDGHEVAVAEDLRYHRIAEEGALWFPKFPFSLWRAARAIGRAVDRHRPDAILVTNAMALLYTGLIARGSTPPVVWTCFDIYHRQTRMTPMISWIAQRARQIVAVSGAVKERLVELGVSADRIETIRNGIDARGRFDPQGVAPATLPEAPLRAGIIGRIYPLKGVHVALDAFERLPDRRVSLFVAGAPWPGHEAYEAGLRARAKPQIFFLGPRSDIPAVLAALDVVLIPSIQPDSWPTAALEAMSMERTVVASRIGGLPEMIRHGRTGYLFEPGDAAGLATIWSGLADGRLPRTGAEARREVLESFTLEAWQAKMNALFGAAAS